MAEKVKEKQFIIVIVGLKTKFYFSNRKSLSIYKGDALKYPTYAHAKSVLDDLKKDEHFRDEQLEIQELTA